MVIENLNKYSEEQIASLQEKENVIRLIGSNGKIEKMYSKGSRGSREETYFYENDRLQKIVIRQFDRNDIEQDTLQHSFDYKSNGELKSIILSTELYSETIYQET